MENPRNVIRPSIIQNLNSYNYDIKGFVSNSSTQIIMGYVKLPKGSGLHPIDFVLTQNMYFKIIITDFQGTSSHIWVHPNSRSIYFNELLASSFWHVITLTWLVNTWEYQVINVETVLLFVNPREEVYMHILIGIVEALKDEYMHGYILALIKCISGLVWDYCFWKNKSNKAVNLKT